MGSFAHSALHLLRLNYNHLHIVSHCDNQHDQHGCQGFVEGPFTPDILSEYHQNITKHYGAIDCDSGATDLTISEK